MWEVLLAAQPHLSIVGLLSWCEGALTVSLIVAGAALQARLNNKTQEVRTISPSRISDYKFVTSQMPSDNVPPRPSAQSRAGPSRTPDFMKYPYPETERILTRLETLPAVKEETKGYVAFIHKRVPACAPEADADAATRRPDVSLNCSTTARCERRRGFRGDKAQLCSCRCSWGARGICTCFSVGAFRFVCRFRRSTRFIGIGG